MKKSWMTTEGELTESSWMVIELLSLDLEEEDIADETGTDKETIREWLADPEFIKLVNQRKVLRIFDILKLKALIAIKFFKDLKNYL